MHRKHGDGALGQYDQPMRLGFATLSVVFDGALDFIPRHDRLVGRLVQQFGKMKPHVVLARFRRLLAEEPVDATQRNVTQRSAYSRGAAQSNPAHRRICEPQALSLDHHYQSDIYHPPRYKPTTAPPPGTITTN